METVAPTLSTLYPRRPQPPFSFPPGRTQGAHRLHATQAEDEVAGEAQVWRSLAAVPASQRCG